MESALLYAGVSIVFGLLLLFFGLKLMKVAVALIGFLIGYSLVYSLALDTGWPEETLIGVSLLGGLGIGAIAFAFYKLAIELGIALFFGNLGYSLLLLTALDSTLVVVLSIIIGILIFIAVRALKLVEGLFAFVTAFQGALMITTAVYVLIFPVELVAAQYASLTVLLGAEVWWLFGWIALGLFGFLSQIASRPSTSSAE